MSRLEQRLNTPRVVLVVGVVAGALNVLLYFGVFLPRVTPVVGRGRWSVGASLPGTISGLDSEASSESHPEASGESHSKVEFRPEERGGSHLDARVQPAASVSPNPRRVVR